MNILITGATGFIGKHIVNKLYTQHNLFVLARKTSTIESIADKVIVIYDEEDTVKLQEAISENQIDGVIHLASLYLYQHKPEEINELISSNITFGVRLLEAVVKSKVNWFINTGTLFQHYNNEDYNPVNLYAATKQAFEVMAKFYYETSTLNFVTLKLSDTYGPGDTRRKIFNLWKQCAETGEPLNMSPGEQIIDILYIDDVVDGYIKLIEQLIVDDSRELCGKSFSLPSAERMTLKELAKKFEEITNTTLNIKWGALPYRGREVMLPVLSERLNNWEPNVYLEEGILTIV